LGYFPFPTASKQALSPPSFLSNGYWGALFLGIKRPEREANQSPPSSSEVKNEWSLPPLRQHIFMACCLVKHRDNFTFTFTSSPQVFLPKFCMDFSSPLACCMHLPSYSPRLYHANKYLVNRASHEAPDYAVISGVPPLPAPWVPHVYMSRVITCAGCLSGAFLVGHVRK